MIDKEIFQKTFEKLHASPDTLTEVLKMAEEEKVIPIKRKRMPRIAVAVLALILVMSMGGVAYRQRSHQMHCKAEAHHSQLRPIQEYHLQCQEHSTWNWQ